MINDNLERDDFAVNFKNMIIKKCAYVLGLLFAAIFSFVGGVCFSYDNPQTEASESIETVRNFSRGHIFGDMLYEEKLKIFPEEKFNDQDDLYSRTVEVVKKFKKYNKGMAEIVGSHKSKIKFTYDKKTFVKIDNPDKDIEESKIDGSWSIMSIKEIFPDDMQCLVSTRYVLYKENKMRIKKYVLSSHYDVFCSLEGKIGVNSEMH